MVYYLGVDIGGIQIKYGLIDDNGEIETIHKKETPMDSLDKFVEVMGEIYDKYAEKIEGIAISMPGIIHSRTGFAVHGGSLKYIKNMNMVSLLEERCPTIIHVENDGKAAALGELWKGNFRGVENGIILALGTGIGGGIISNGKLLKGNHYSAGELSFIKTNSDKSFDEDYMFGFQTGLKKLFKSISIRCAIPLEKIDGYLVFRYANEGNKDVLACLNEYCRTLAIQIFNLQVILDPEKIVISGGISKQPLLLELIKKNVAEIFKEKNTELFYAPLIERSYHGNKATIIGALYNYKKNEELLFLKKSK
ncbi:Sugar kinase of the NBD/HSP70 family, may contain an N-terminal HTH domain [Carnobacterium iners]|uniref:Sugar kinase of the NBD/HSP70 family, may contain an N-terminal HTH domain n=1 Tax=Carnobacterium iners TaxID=1073423 RepID=A0A1X7N7A3_9LACT|nr:ROK family protein [Carnobacterium iners]SEK43153.1 Sugar kinase of the NBD/HSP70 family, may contain an N-terminal HTH domain [Carnobacterium iners]SMH32500.1 Sugar kinase of the NBD/HSP70 family, may contain an N-terminal HTH domain [Carnobacterium iners]